MEARNGFVIPAAFELIDEAHIQALVDSERAEDRYIDFKLDWSQDHPWEPLAADVCAFANTDGGDIVIGIAEDDRAASKVVGVACDRVDQKIRQAEEGIRSRIEPLASFRIRYIERAAGNGVFVIRTGASAAAPHRVSHGGTFYARGSAGNREMDIFQVREAFLRGTFAEEKIRQFRRDRIGSLERIDPNIQGSRFVWALFHVVSMPSMMRSRLIPGTTLFESARSLRIFGDGSSEGAACRFNLDGLVKGREQANVQVFRDGKVESRRYLGQINLHPTAAAPPPLDLRIIRDGVRATLKDYVRFLDALEFPPPFSVSLTLANVADIPFTGDGVSTLMADRAVLEFPEAVVADTQTSSIASATGQLTDMLYQAFGRSGTQG
jgi:hypothetical protein